MRERCELPIAKGEHPLLVPLSPQTLRDLREPASARLYLSQNPDTLNTPQTQRTEDTLLVPWRMRRASRNTIPSPDRDTFSATPKTHTNAITEQNLIDQTQTKVYRDIIINNTYSQQKK